MSQGVGTVAQAICQAVAQLAAAGVDSPRLDAELLLVHVLEGDRASLLARPEQVLTYAQAERFRALVARRLAREPLAYIVGHKEFYGLDLYVDRNVLIPRPETEGLVELALGWLRDRLARMSPEQGPMKVADVGTGSGAIAVALAYHVQGISVYAMDRTQEALEVARRNAARFGVDDRVTLLAGDLLQPVPSTVDLVLANLPYITTDEMSGLMPEVGRYEPRTALHGGPDGLDLIRQLLCQAPRHLRAGGALMLEIGWGQGPAAAGIARQAYPGADVSVRQDLAGLDRVLVIQTEEA